MLSLVLIQVLCGAVSRHAVKNGDKWKPNRVWSGKETIITVPSRFLRHTDPEGKSGLMAHSSSLEVTRNANNSFNEYDFDFKCHT